MVLKISKLFDAFKNENTDISFIKKDFIEERKIIDSYILANKDILNRHFSEDLKTSRIIFYFTNFLILIIKRHYQFSTIYRYPKVFIYLEIENIKNVEDQNKLITHQKNILMQEGNTFENYRRSICFICPIMIFKFLEVYISIKDFTFSENLYIIHFRDAYYKDDDYNKYTPSILETKNFYTYDIESTFNTLPILSCFLIEYFTRNIEPPSKELVDNLIDYYFKNQEKINEVYFGSIRINELLLVEPEDKEQQDRIPFPKGMTQEFYEKY